MFIYFVVGDFLLVKPHHRISGRIVLLSTQSLARSTGTAEVEVLLLSPSICVHGIGMCLISFLQQSTIMLSKLTSMSKTAIVCMCVSLCPATGWHTVQVVPCLGQDPGSPAVYGSKVWAKKALLWSLTSLYLWNIAAPLLPTLNSL